MQAEVEIVNADILQAELRRLQKLLEDAETEIARLNGIIMLQNDELLTLRKPTGATGTLRARR